MEKVKIERLDDFGNGIGYINEKIIFIPNCLPEEIVECKIIEEKKNYYKANLLNVVNESKKRVEPKCKYYNLCGGCYLQHMNYEDTANYKLEKITNIFKKNKLGFVNIEIIKNREDFYYRNKIELKINNGKVGFYKNKSHDIVEIDECIISKKSINNVIKDLKYCNLKDGKIIIRANYNDEILLIINTKEDFKYDKLINNNKIVGIILNNELVYGEDYLVEAINDLYFKVSYDAFFQVNEYICSKLFDIIFSNIDENSNVLDLYCGVGTLSLVTSQKANKVYGIEIVENAVLNAITNAKINKKDNLYFMCGDVPKLINKINDRIDIIMVDPPRAGLDLKTVDIIANYKPKKIIYVSCDPQTLVRDLKKFISIYDIKKVTILDMFSYSYHFETVCILEKRSD